MQILRPKAERAEPIQSASSRKMSAEARIRQLSSERKRALDRVRELEARLKDAEGREPELIELRAERHNREERQKWLKAQLPKVVTQGRQLFGDFDQVISGAQIAPEAFEALQASSNCAELMYALGLGCKMIAVLRQRQALAQAEQERIEYYRRQNQEHFAGVKEQPVSV